MTWRRLRYGDRVEVIYDTPHWELLRHLRKQAIKIIEALTVQFLNPAIHGSVARGDVNIDSDVDVYIPYTVPSYVVEVSLTMKGFEIHSRKIAQATPGHAPKAHIYLDAEERRSVTFPLVSFRPSELEFYKFGGVLKLGDLKADRRVPGCNKRQILIEPTLRGHFESPIQSREAEVSRIVGVSVDTVNERKRILTRRAQIGKTGIMLSVYLQEDEVLEEVLKRLIDSNPIIRRRCAAK